MTHLLLGITNYLSDFRLHLETTAPKITNSQGSYFDHDLNDYDSNHSSEMRGLCLMKLFIVFPPMFNFLFLLFGLSFIDQIFFKKSHQALTFYYF